MITKRDYQILQIIKEKDQNASLNEISKILGLDLSTVMRAVLNLEEKNLVKTSEYRESIFKLTDEGRVYAKDGLPEKRLVETTTELGGCLPIKEAAQRAGVHESLLNITLGWVAKKGWGRITKKPEGVFIEADRKPEEGTDEVILRTLLKSDLNSSTLNPQQYEIIEELKRRKLVTEKQFTIRTAKLTELGLEYLQKKPMIDVEEELKVLTGDLITSGKWREVKLQEYNVTAAPPVIYPGKKHFYLEFLEEFKEILLSMGFAEAQGPYVEVELWNFDALFQPQDHPAREIHGSYHLTNPKFGIIKDKQLAKRIGQTHENGWITGSTGWRYRWNPDIARKLVLRTQTTAVSARFLSQHRKPPIKMFCISRVFRPDVLDAKHSMEFFHFDGIIMDSNLTFRNLLGILSEIAKALDAGRIEFKPGYFPFTEPSAEMFAYHSKIGWMEIAGSGVFRPEVTKPLGIDHPVLAWGIGVDRLAMVKLGVDDIRELHSKRLDFIREK